MSQQVVAENVPLNAMLELALHPAAEMVLGAGHPEHFTHGQIGQMGEVHVSLVEDDDHPRPHTRTEFTRPPGFVFVGGIHDGKAGQEGLQIQPQMAFGGGFAVAMFGPVHTAGNELNGGGIHEVDRALEAEGELGPTASAKTGVSLLQVAEDGPEKILSQL